MMSLGPKHLWRFFVRALRIILSAHRKGHHQEIIFPIAFIDPICEVAEERHRLIVGIKLINCNLRAEIKTCLADTRPISSTNYAQDRTHLGYPWLSGPRRLQPLFTL